MTWLAESGRQRARHPHELTHPAVPAPSRRHSSTFTRPSAPYFRSEWLHSDRTVPSRRAAGGDQFVAPRWSSIDSGSSIRSSAAATAGPAVPRAAPPPERSRPRAPGYRCPTGEHGRSSSSNGTAPAGRRTAFGSHASEGTPRVLEHVPTSPVRRQFDAAGAVEQRRPSTSQPDNGRTRPAIACSTGSCPPPGPLSAMTRACPGSAHALECTSPQVEASDSISRPRRGVARTAPRQHHAPSEWPPPRARRRRGSPRGPQQAVDGEDRVCVSPGCWPRKLIVARNSRAPWRTPARARHDACQPWQGGLVNSATGCRAWQCLLQRRSVARSIA